MQRYGRPAYNIRWQYVCQWGQQCNESDMMSMTAEKSSSTVRETSQPVDANVIGYRIFQCETVREHGQMHRPNQKSRNKAIGMLSI